MTLAAIVEIMVEVVMLVVEMRTMKKMMEETREGEIELR